MTLQRPRLRRRLCRIFERHRHFAGVWYIERLPQDQRVLAACRARLYEAAGLTHFLAITNFGGLEHKKVLRSMELMATHVFPAFR